MPAPYRRAAGRQPVCEKSQWTFLATVERFFAFVTRPPSVSFFIACLHLANQDRTSFFWALTVANSVVGLSDLALWPIKTEPVVLDRVMGLSYSRCSEEQGSAVEEAQKSALVKSSSVDDLRFKDTLPHRDYIQRLVKVGRLKAVDGLTQVEVACTDV